VSEPRQAPGVGDGGRAASRIRLCRVAPPTDGNRDACDGLGEWRSRFFKPAA